MKKGLLKKPFVLFGSILDKVIFTHAIVLGLPTLLYYCILSSGGNLMLLHMVIPALYMVTSLVVMAESVATAAIYHTTGKRRPQMGVIQRLFGQRPPRSTKMPDLSVNGTMPKCSLVVAAYLPNEQGIILETLEEILSTMDRPEGGLEVILAYNSPTWLPVEEDLQRLARIYPELRLLKVENSRSKAENVNAALQIVSGEITGILDADHRPNPDCFTKAWGWLATGRYAVVQGRNVIRNHRKNFLTRMIAVEFESMYAVSHPAKSLLVDMGMFCGSNGYWRTDVLRRIRFAPHMMTEDIDATLRTLLRGYKIVHDPTIITTELAPEDTRSFWFQRKRWAQGWLEVSLKHQGPMLASNKLDLWQKSYWTMLLIYSAAFHFVALQIFPIFSSLTLSNMDAPIISPTYVWITTAMTILSGPCQTMAAWIVRNRVVKQSVWDFVIYSFFIPFYCLFKNVIVVIAIYDHIIGNTEWVVTQRGLRDAVSPVALPYAKVGDRAS
jgi:cellulose synthase/poly-beta-1,6-N-acetylglucosamine synthase-like glycosyltransferase